MLKQTIQTNSKPSQINPYIFKFAKVIFLYPEKPAHWMCVNIVVFVFVVVYNDVCTLFGRNDQIQVAKYNIYFVSVLTINKQIWQRNIHSLNIDSLTMFETKYYTYISVNVFQHHNKKLLKRK